MCLSRSYPQVFICWGITKEKDRGRGWRLGENENGDSGRTLFVQLSSQEWKSHTVGVADEHANVGLHMLRDYQKEKKKSVSDNQVSGQAPQVPAGLPSDWTIFRKFSRMR